MLRMQRMADDYLETLEMELPGLVTISPRQYVPRYATIADLSDAFTLSNIEVISLEQLNIDSEITGRKGSPTQIIDVFSPTAEKENVVLKGTPKNITKKLFELFGDKISSAIGKDIQR